MRAYRSPAHATCVSQYTIRKGETARWLTVYITRSRRGEPNSAARNNARAIHAVATYLRASVVSANRLDRVNGVFRATVRFSLPKSRRIRR